MSDTTPEDLIEHLKNPDFYPHRPQEVHHIQTHISHVFIASPYVYKIKKPVAFDFLDFSTLDKRKWYCEEEVRLNRRLCESAYLGVAEIHRTDNGWSLRAEEGSQPAEYAVHMKELPADRFLKSLVEENRVTRSHMDRTIQHLLQFYERQAPDREVQKWGMPEQVAARSQENFDQSRPFAGSTLDPLTLRVAERLTQRFLEKRRPLLEQRFRDGHVLDTHGDLRLDHINITDESVCIYDCIEFSDRLRCQDVAADIAFLAMDLDFNYRPDLSRYLVDEIAARRDDLDLHKLIDFYKSYRAWIRGKVNSLTAEDPDVEQEAVERAGERASRYFAQGLSHLVIGSRPTVLVFMGPVAGGKSTLAGEVARHLHLPHHSSDRIRKEKAGLPPESRTPPEKRKELYTTRVTEMTYREMIRQAEQSLEHRPAAILDATFGNPDHRRRLIETFQPANRRVVFIEASAPTEVRHQRLQARASADGVISDARAEDMDKLDPRYQPPGEEEGTHLIRSDTSTPPEQTVETLLTELSDLTL